MGRSLAVILAVLVVGCEGVPDQLVPIDPPLRRPADGGLDAGPLGVDAGQQFPDAGAVAPALDAGVTVTVTDAGTAPNDPTHPGPFLAGVKTLSFRDPARNRTFAVEVWYPVTPGQSGGRANEYKLQSALGTLATIQTSARRDAAPAGGAPRPVVLFSHGFGGIRFQSYFLTEYLATHGYLVISPDHPGNTLGDFGQLGSDAAAAQSAVDRPLDALFALDQALAGATGISADATRIAITGHSFGGWTALEVARRDPRVKVILPMAPGFKKGASPAFVAQLARPLILFGGSLDHTTPFESDQHAPYDLAARPRALVKLTGAGHLDFSNLCEVPLASLFVKDGCDAQRIDPKDVQQRAKVLATAFLGRHLLGIPGYDAWLSPSWVMGLGKLEYWSEP